MQRILLVDDDPANLRLLATFLAPDGYELTLAETGDAALRCLAAQAADLVLLDLVMPGLDGLEVLAHLKGEPSTRLVPVVMVTGSSERRQRLQAIALGADEFLTKPVDRVELRTRVRALLRLKQYVDHLERSENVLVAMARAVEARDPDLQDHCDRMAERVTAIGRQMGLGTEDLTTLRLGAYLHDIGKIGIPDAVLLKPGPLTEEERAVIRRHPVLGESILGPLGSLQAVLPLVRHHHERLDGSGYPDGLQGEEISLLVRILSASDVFDALTTHRPYRSAWSNEKALEVLNREAGQGWWDADVVACLARQVLGGA